jgi:hypothetical protein
LKSPLLQPLGQQKVASKAAVWLHARREQLATKQGGRDNPQSQLSVPRFKKKTKEEAAL